MALKIDAKFECFSTLKSPSFFLQFGPKHNILGLSFERIGY